MKKQNKPVRPVAHEPQRRLSPWRVMLALVVLGAIGFGSMFGMRQWKSVQALASHKPWSAPYVDVTATPAYAFEQLHSDAILSFVVSAPSDGCTPSWGGSYSLVQANNLLDLDRRVARLRQKGHDIAVSFGGLKNNELAVKCTDTTKLEAAYQSVIDRYGITTIDLDLEKTGLSDGAAAVRRATALAHLQSVRRQEGKKLAIWLTLPVTPQGLDENGTNGVSQLLAKKVDLAGINLMTMDYGNSLPKGQDMLGASKSALSASQRQLGILYQRVGIHLNDATLWSKIGATPMIGQNDTENEVFSLKNAAGLNAFARSHKLSRMSMWSANRDLTCGGNYVDLKVVSDSCSGVNQAKGEFASTLGAGFNGNVVQAAGIITHSEALSSTQQKPDDPKTSPYPIWSASAAYLEGTKVVWHHNVYQAKWWTQGDTPDNPVLQSWQTPWDLVGPVLPGEKPIAQPTLPAGTYKDWSGTSAYNTADRVLFNGVPYQAKWWNQGSSPAAATSNPDSSPWVPLTQAQVNEVLSSLGQS
jgi:chitinase